MPRLFPRKRDDEPSPRPSEPESEKVDLEGDEHAWWAQQEVSEVWKPRERKPKAAKGDPEEERDILAEHFGDDWRTSFEFSGPSEEDLEDERRKEQQSIDDEDPYKVLGVEPTATWEEIVEAHRAMARTHHPDRLFGQSEEEKAGGEERIRVINTAYQELHVRRGK